MTNVARETLWPTDPNIALRVAVLYVGQGASAVLFAAAGDGYQVLLHDIHLDENLGGIDVVRLMIDLLEGERLDIFINSHPHNDHLCGVEKLHDAVDIDTVWHSGHIPSKEHEQAYQELQRVIDRVIADGGDEIELCGSRTPMSVGMVECYQLAPAQHVKDDISDETTEGRDRRIHEHCAVLRFGIDDTWIMLPGDADRDAWEQWITNYWKREGKIAAAILAAPHHGSRTFFRYEEEDEPYRDALEAINPDYVVISAPQRAESPHGHPHASAIELYAEQVGEENILHTGADRYSFICDIFTDGEYTITDDKGALVDAYALSNDDDPDGGAAKRWEAPQISFPRTRIDDRPMGSD